MISHLGLPKLIRHMMRRTVATFLGFTGATDMDLMDLGGWKSMEMARRYRKVVGERLHDLSVAHVALVYVEEETDRIVHRIYPRIDK